MTGNEGPSVREHIAGVIGELRELAEATGNREAGVTAGQLALLLAIAPEDMLSRPAPSNRGA